MMRNLAPGDLVKKAWDLCNQDWPGCSIMNMMHWKVIVFGGGHIVLQRFVHVRCHFQPLPTKLVFAYFDRGSHVNGRILWQVQNFNFFLWIEVECHTARMRSFLNMHHPKVSLQSAGYHVDGAINETFTWLIMIVNWFMIHQLSLHWSSLSCHISRTHAKDLWRHLQST